jgi:CubicO group peptidase (beta-lactamase class C family)
MGNELVAAALGLCACASTGSSSAHAPAPVSVDAPALERWTDGEIAGRVPSAVLALVDRKGLRWHRGVGSRDAQGGAPPDRTTVYRIGSVTKLFTATALLQLRDAGKLGLDDTVARWVPELAALGTSTPQVTIRNLVTHTSGIPSVGDGSAPYWEQSPPDRAAMLKALGAPLAFAPGARSEYSNAGMALVGEIITRASGESFRAYVDGHVLAPLGMRTAVWDRAAVPVDRLAIGTGPGTVDPPHWQLGAFEAAGGLYASLDDMVQFAQFSLGGAPTVLSTASLAEAQRNQATLPGPHGVAWIVGGEGRQRFAAHTGSTMDYSASLVVLPDAGLAAVVLASGGDAELVECAAAALVRAAATGKAPEPCRSDLSPAVRAIADAALVRLRAVLVTPTPEAIAETFEPAFLAQIPPATIVELVGQLRDRVGNCVRHEVTEASGMGVRGVLHCERGDVKFELGTEPEPPHRIAGIVFPEL